MALGENVPVPVVVHTPKPVVTFTEKGKGLLAQELSFEVITVLGNDVKVINTESREAKHVPFPVDTRYTKTEPVAVSVVLGI